MTARDVKGQVQRRFGDVAANYRTSRVHAAGPDLDLMAASALLAEDAVVLDAGCGAGHASLALAPRASCVLACDFTRAMLDQLNALATQRRVQNVVAQIADVENLPYMSHCVDLVVTRFSAHHWLHPERALAECRRLLKPNGALLISDIMAREDYAQDTFLQAIELLRDPSHVRDYRLSEWQSMLRAAGFKSETLLAYDLTLHFGAWTQRMATPSQNAAMILSLFQGAPAEIKRAFNLPDRIDSDDFEFTIPGAVLKATVAAD